MFVPESSSRVKDTNVSDLHADLPLDQGKQAAGESFSDNNVVLQSDVSVMNTNVFISNLKTNVLVYDDVVNTDDSDVSDKCGDVSDKSKSHESVTGTYKPDNLVTQSESCTCTCGKIKEWNKVTKLEKSGKNFHVKKHTCFNCGTPGHISRNCPNHVFVPFYTQKGVNESWGRSLKRKSSRFHSIDGDRNINKERKWANIEKNKRFLNKNLTGTLTRPKVVKPNSVSSKSSSGSLANLRRKSKRLTKEKHFEKTC